LHLAVDESAGSHERDQLGAGDAVPEVLGGVEGLVGLVERHFS
jgi:hypothetical protein